MEVARLTKGSSMVGIFSKRSNNFQEKYTTFEKEAFSILKSLHYYKNYLWKPGTVFTDHSNLKFLNNSKIERLQRWLLSMDEFNIYVVYTKGEDNKLPDFVSISCSLSRNISNQFPFMKEKTLKDEKMKI